MAEKSWGGTVKGWFIVDGDGEKEPSAPAAPAKGAPKGKPPASSSSNSSDAAADDIIRRYAGGGSVPAGKPSAKPDTSPARSPSGEAPPDFGGGSASKGASAGAPPTTAGGQVDFPKVFLAAGVDPEEQDRVEKALALLSQLPAETPIALKKQIVETSLKAFGVPVDSIIESAVAEIQALHDCISGGAGDMQTLLEDSEKRLAALEEQMTQVRAIMEARKQEQRGLELACRAQGLRVQQILEFFGQEKVGQVVHDSPRLEEPKKS